ncbi:Coiled-coil domain-containing protein 90B, mitochondrial [Varanus komodoensis]|nr:Coiled-coil domain-containing protein 90B, mitochondrial [Varanus komodoensis]
MSLCFLGVAASNPAKSYDVRRVEITPLEQRKLTFDTHSLVRDLEARGFGKEQAESLVSALSSLSTFSLETIYKDMVTQTQQVASASSFGSLPSAHLNAVSKPRLSHTQGIADAWAGLPKRLLRGSVSAQEENGFLKKGTQSREIMVIRVSAAQGHKVGGQFAGEAV